ncbi:MAG: hypothetical protein LAP21_03760 [Acidobacteriia bacterium]|nr:hypothetical protein [Terriglobia bacterium]
MRLWCFLIAAFIFSGAAWAQGAPAHTGRDPIIGKWKMDARKSRFRDPKDRIAAMTRVYSVDGDKIKVWWDSHPVTGKGSSHSYSATCDGTVQPAYDTAQVKCEYKNRSWVDGEFIDESDPTHRYYSRVVSLDGKSMKILWFEDSEHKRLKDVLQFERVEEAKKK